MAHEDDDLVEAAQQQFRVINAARMRSQAQLAEYRADRNSDGIQEELQNIANLDNAASNLTNLARRHAQSQQAPPPQTDQEWLTKAPERMDYNDVAKMASKSKYGFDDASFRAGIAEVQRRRPWGVIMYSLNDDNLNTRLAKAKEAKEMTADLGQWDRQTRSDSNFDQTVSAEKFAAKVRSDRRYDHLDPERVAERISHCRQSGAVFDIDDQHLRRGSAPRPAHKW
jgi:hypothetical protein